MEGCPHCTYKSEKRYNIERHIQRCHGSADTKAVCSKCKKVFSSHYHLKRHLDKCKGIESALECEWCHAVFPYRKALYRHKKKGCAMEAKHVQLREYNHPYLHHITVDFARACLDMGWRGIARLVDAVYFDTNHLQNFFVRMKSMKQKLVEVRVKGGWEVRDLDQVAKQIIDYCSSLILSRPEIPRACLCHDDILRAMSEIIHFPNTERRVLIGHIVAKLEQWRRNQNIVYDGVYVRHFLHTSESI